MGHLHIVLTKWSFHSRCQREAKDQTDVSLLLLFPECPEPLRVPLKLCFSVVLFNHAWPATCLLPSFLSLCFWPSDPLQNDALYTRVKMDS